MSSNASSFITIVEVPESGSSIDNRFEVPMDEGAKNDRLQRMKLINDTIAAKVVVAGKPHQSQEKTFVAAGPDNYVCRSNMDGTIDFVLYGGQRGQNETIDTIFTELLNARSSVHETD